MKPQMCSIDDTINKKWNQIVIFLLYFWISVLFFMLKLSQGFSIVLTPPPHPRKVNCSLRQLFDKSRWPLSCVKKYIIHLGCMTSALVSFALELLGGRWTIDGAFIPLVLLLVYFKYINPALCRRFTCFKYILV